MPQPVALSTMWMQLRYDRLAPFIEAVHSLDIPFVELSHIVTPTQLAELPTSLYGTVRVLHHPCPNPGDVPDLSDPTPTRRAHAITALQRTITWAARIGARVVVLHLGRVAVDSRWENALRARFLQGDSSEEFLHHVRALRAAQQPPHWDAIRAALDVVLPFARQHDVQLALENGEWWFNLPSLEEARILLDTYPDTLGYWVDTGHATIIERLGGTPLDAWLRLAPDRLPGVHYHDVNGLRDHLIPGRGTIAWDRIAPLVPAHALPTAEWDWYYTAEEIRQGVAVLNNSSLIS